MPMRSASSHCSRASRARASSPSAQGRALVLEEQADFHPTECLRASAQRRGRARGRVSRARPGLRGTPRLPLLQPHVLLRRLVTSSTVDACRYGIRPSWCCGRRGWWARCRQPPHLWRVPETAAESTRARAPLDGSARARPTSVLLVTATRAARRPTGRGFAHSCSRAAGGAGRHRALRIGASAGPAPLRNAAGKRAFGARHHPGNAGHAAGFGGGLVPRFTRTKDVATVAVGARAPCSSKSPAGGGT